jgi:hypothetical protein
MVRLIGYLLKARDAFLHVLLRVMTLPTLREMDVQRILMIRQRWGE